jgi:Rieske Fe-S protein
LNKIAAYRDEHGVLHCFSAVCPHLKGLVHWNEAESTWDCPCHGSRFSRTGKVLNGPAIKGLTPVETPESQSPQLVAPAERPTPPLTTPGLDFT